VRNRMVLLKVDGEGQRKADEMDSWAIGKPCAASELFSFHLPCKKNRTSQHQNIRTSEHHNTSFQPLHNEMIPITK